MGKTRNEAERQKEWGVLDCEWFAGERMWEHFSGVSMAESRRETQHTDSQKGLTGAELWSTSMPTSLPARQSRLHAGLTRWDSWSRPKAVKHITNLMKQVPEWHHWLQWHRSLKSSNFGYRAAERAEFAPSLLFNETRQLPSVPHAVSDSLSPFLWYYLKQHNT